MSFITIDSSILDLSDLLESEDEIPEWLDLSYDFFLEHLVVPEIYEAIENFVAILSANNISIDTNAFFKAKIVTNEIAGLKIRSLQNVFSFSLQKKEDKVVLTFGNNILECERCSTDSEVIKIKALPLEDITIRIQCANPQKKGEKPAFQLALKKPHLYLFGVFGALTDKADYMSLLKVKSSEEFLLFFDELASGSYAKLVDFARLFVLNNSLPNAFPILLNVKSWKKKKPEAGYEEYGESFVFTIADAPIALTDKGVLLPKALYVNINEGFAAFKKLDLPAYPKDGKNIPSFAEKALECIQTGGLLLVVISSPHPKKPLEFRPEHSLMLIPATSSKLPALIERLEQQHEVVQKYVEQKNKMVLTALKPVKDA